MYYEICINWNYEFGLVLTWLEKNSVNTIFFLRTKSSKEYYFLSIHLHINIVHTS